MNTPPAKEPVNIFDRLQGLSQQITAYRKIIIDLSVMLLALYLIVVLLVTSFQRKLLVLPVEIPDKLLKAGYTTPFFTEKMLDRVTYMKTIATTYYQKNDIKLVTADERPEMVNILVKNTPFEGFKGLINDFINRNQRNAQGKLMAKDEKLQMTFKIDGASPFVVETSSADSVIFSTAEYIMQETDPYSLAAYYYQVGEFSKCLQLVQKLLDKNDTKYKYLAFHIRGNTYIKMGNALLKDTAVSNNAWLGKEYLSYAKNIFDSAIATNTSKSPWLSYNSMGVLYQDLRKFDTAKRWYRISMKSNNTGAYPFYNYGNILLDQYQEAPSKNFVYLDSAVLYFKEAIKRNTVNLDHYIGLLRAYTMARNVNQSKELFFKCLDVDPNNQEVYLLMVKMYTDLNDLQMAANYVSLMQSQGLLPEAEAK